MTSCMFILIILGHLFLHGQTNFGDSIEDEWLIVYLLRELTRQFPDLWVKVVDVDGEFLLVEAADILPRWLEPEVADNRVGISLVYILKMVDPVVDFDVFSQIWLHAGRLLIIPPPLDSDAKLRTPKKVSPISMEEALGIISAEPDSLLHYPNLQSEAFERIRHYPDQIADNLHHAMLTIPRKVAYMLYCRPEMISAIVEAFYLRDPIALQSLRQQGEDQGGSGDNPFPVEDLVSVSVRFAKAGYAQLKSQHFSPPTAWHGRILHSQLNANSQSKDRLEMGMKVTCGLVMLVTDPQNQEKDVVVYIRRLLGSISKGGVQLPSDDEMDRWDKRQDDEGWLDIDFDDLEHELSNRNDGRSSSAEEKGPGFGDKRAQENLRRLVQRFESFMNDDSAGLDGVDDDNLSENDDDDDDEDDEGDVSLDEEEFSKMMREMMGLPVLSSPPPTTTTHHISSQASVASVLGGQILEEIDSNESINVDGDSEHEREEVERIMHGMETELRQAGVLDVNPRTMPLEKKKEKMDLEANKTSSLKDDSLLRINEIEDEDDDGEEETKGDREEEVVGEEDVNVDVDVQLARNLLESFKAQSGLAGPTGNLLASLGIHLPRDD